MRFASSQRRFNSTRSASPARRPVAARAASICWNRAAELGVGAAQGGFGIGSEMTREVDASEQKIAKLLGNRRFRRLRPDRLPKFGHLFEHLREYRLDSGPVEADPSRTLL